MTADPRVRRMTDITAHGLIPFDVPLISEIAPGLWQGGCETGLVLPRFIKHLVSLYSPERYKIRHELASSVNVAMLDSTEQDTGQVTALAGWVSACRKKAPVLVHCQAGLNRSGMVVARSLMLEGMTAGAAITLIREKRSPACLCNPAFEAWLRQAADPARIGLAAPVEALWPDGPAGAMSVRTCNTLLRAGLKTVGGVAGCTRDDLLDIRHFGYGQLAEVRRVLSAAGLALQDREAREADSDGS